MQLRVGSRTKQIGGVVLSSLKICDRVVLMVSPRKGVRHFDMRGKLAPRYVGQFRVLAIVGAVSFSFQLPEVLADRDSFLFQLAAGSHFS